MQSALWMKKAKRMSIKCVLPAAFVMHIEVHVSVSCLLGVGGYDIAIIVSVTWEAAGHCCFYC